MPARNFSNTQINSTDWDDAVDSNSLPLTNAGNNRITFNSTDNRYEIRIGGTVVATIDSSGNLRIRGVVMTEETGL